MSGYDCRNKRVFCFRRNTVNDEADDVQSYSNNSTGVKLPKLSLDLPLIIAAVDVVGRQRRRLKHGGRRSFALVDGNTHGPPSRAFDDGAADPSERQGVWSGDVKAAVRRYDGHAVLLSGRKTETGLLDGHFQLLGDLVQHHRLLLQHHLQRLEAASTRHNNFTNTGELCTR